MSVATTATVSQLSWNRLNDLVHASTNRRLLVAALHADNACIAGAPSCHIRDNRTVAIIIDRAIQNYWNDVLEAATTSRHMTLKDYATILRCGKVFAKDVYQGILNSRAAESATILGLLRNAPYASVKEGAEVKRTALVIEVIESAHMDPEVYALEDGDEHEDITQAVTIALALDRIDLLNELVATGCTRTLTAERIAMTHGLQLQAA